jgi:hypothetical protein
MYWTEVTSCKNRSYLVEHSTVQIRVTQYWNLIKLSIGNVFDLKKLLINNITKKTLKKCLDLCLKCSKDVVHLMESMMNMKISQSRGKWSYVDIRYTNVPM